MAEKKYHVIAKINGVRTENDVFAVDQYDAVDVFQLENNCYNTGDSVKIISVDEV